jgi:hypothetical protein
MLVTDADIATVVTENRSLLFALSGQREVTRARFDPALCCTHVWLLTADWTETPEIPGECEACANCGALCKRGADGRIEEYDNAPPMPVWDRELWRPDLVEQGVMP